MTEETTAAEQSAVVPEQPLPIHTLWNMLMLKVRAVGKTSRNIDQNYNFRGVDAVVNAVGPVMRDLEIVPTFEVLDINYRDVRTSRDKPAREVTLRVRYTFTGPAGDAITILSVGESMDSGDKGTPKAMSVALRIALLQALMLPTDEPDPDSESYERADPTSQASNQSASSSNQGESQTPAAKARALIAKIGDEKGLTREETAAKFLQVTGVEIGVASVAKLNSFAYQFRKWDPSAHA